jgi:hypothetical protein
MDGNKQWKNSNEITVNLGTISGRGAGSNVIWVWKAWREGTKQRKIAVGH